MSLHWIQTNTGRIQDFHCGEKTSLEKVYFCHYSVDDSPSVCFFLQEGGCCGGRGQKNGCCMSNGNGAQNGSEEKINVSDLRSCC